MSNIEIDTSENAARNALQKWGLIEKPGPEVLELAQRMLRGAEEALNEDPDVTSSDRAHEEADGAVAGTNALDLVKDTPELFAADDEGLAGDSPTPEQKVIAATYNILSGICTGAIEDNRPDITEVDWDEANPRRGYVLIGRNEQGFIYVQASLRTRHEDQPHQNNQDHRLVLALVGETRDGGGQISASINPNEIEPAPDWTADELRLLWEMWDRYHLNGMQAACPHQRMIAVQAGKQPHEYWTTPTRGRDEDDRPVECPECGYEYGTEWLFDELPADVVAFIDSKFPQARTVRE